MTEPPRPPGDGTGVPPDPTSPIPPGSYSSPGEAPAPGYGPPPTSGQPYSPPGGYAPPPSAPGAGYPPGGAYPPGGSHPPGGYPPGGYGAGPGAPPPGYASADDKTWTLIAHFGGALAMFVSGGTLGWVPPLIAMIAKGPQSPTVRAHAVDALNFQLLWSIIGIAGYILGSCLAVILVGFAFFVAPLVAWAVGTIVGIIAGIKANEGSPYKYPMTVSIVK